ncbi:hypothetical protein [Streptomyces sp. NPDC001717]|uniref:hypothetical protein n=1 Tax=Streptomyces sp. NPDC001717 TaxID=3364604 RepID=UPI00367C09AE
MDLDAGVAVEAEVLVAVAVAVAVAVGEGESAQVDAVAAGVLHLDPLTVQGALAALVLGVLDAADDDGGGRALAPKSLSKSPQTVCFAKCGHGRNSPL